jgi:hypothetical protein
MSGREHLAFVLWIRLLDMDLEEVAFGEHGEGMDWALRLINDVHYKLAVYYEWAGRTDEAIGSLKKYVHNRKHGVTSLYALDEAKARLARLGGSGRFRGP